MKEGKIRVNITLPEELKEWFQSYAEGFGVPMSGMMAIALAQFREQNEGLKAMKNIEVVYEKLQDLENRLEKNQGQ